MYPIMLFSTCLVWSLKAETVGKKQKLNMVWYGSLLRGSWVTQVIRVTQASVEEAIEIVTSVWKAIKIVCDSWGYFWSRESRTQFSQFYSWWRHNVTQCHNLHTTCLQRKIPHACPRRNCVTRGTNFNHASHANVCCRSCVTPPSQWSVTTLRRSSPQNIIKKSRMHFMRT